MHRDLKPENVLIENIETLEVKITDFGFATYFDEKAQSGSVFLGSALYMAPEIVSQYEDHYDQKVDIWGAGVIAFMLLTGEPPFEAENQDELFR
jgi:serine/threonine protein kinase